MLTVGWSVPDDAVNSLGNLSGNLARQVSLHKAVHAVVVVYSCSWLHAYAEQWEPCAGWSQMHVYVPKLLS